MNIEKKLFERPSFFYDDSDKDEKEVLIDYFISWTIRCAVSDNDEISKEVRNYSKKILLKILENEDEIENNDFSTINIKEVKTFKQWEGIDVDAEVILEINGVKKEYAILFENKLYTHIHDNQLKRYQEVFDKFYTNVKDKSHYKKVYIFLTCNDPVPKEDVLECEKNNFSYFPIQELRDSLNSNDLTGDELFDEFWFRYY